MADRITALQVLFLVVAIAAGVAIAYYVAKQRKDNDSEAAEAAPIAAGPSRPIVLRPGTEWQQILLHLLGARRGEVTKIRDMHGQLLGSVTKLHEDRWFIRGLHYQLEGEHTTWADVSTRLEKWVRARNQDLEFDIPGRGVFYWKAPPAVHDMHEASEFRQWQGTSGSN